MSKPSRKTPPPSQPQTPAGRGKAPLVIGAVAIVAIAVGAYTFMQTERAEPSASPAAANQPAATPGDVVPTPDAAQAPPPAPAVALAAHPQKDFPPLELPAYPLGRSPEVITAAYMFAAEHPEVLTYVPCFAGASEAGIAATRIAS